MLGLGMRKQKKMLSARGKEEEGGGVLHGGLLT